MVTISNRKFQIQCSVTVTEKKTNAPKREFLDGAGNFYFKVICDMHIPKVYVMHNIQYWS